MPTEFQEAVYKLTRQIPKGKVSTYKDIADALGTAAYRAVGTALKHNPDIPQTPCHRVVNTNGALGGYAEQPHRKKELLRKEGVVVKNNTIDLSKFRYEFD